MAQYNGNLNALAVFIMAGLFTGLAAQPGYRYRYPWRSQNDDSSADGCVSVRRAYHYFQPARVPACEAFQNQSNTISELQQQLQDLDNTLLGQIGALNNRLDDIDSEVGTLQGDGIDLTTLSIDNSSDNRLLCQFNSNNEVHALCSFLGIRLPNPYFTYINCNDSGWLATGRPCPTNFWYLLPGCLTPNENDIFSCITDLPAGVTCSMFVLYSCSGYSQGVFAPNSDGLQASSLTLMSNGSIVSE